MSQADNSLQENTIGKIFRNSIFLPNIVYQYQWQLEVRHVEKQEHKLELVSKELNHFGVIAGLFRQIGGHSSRFVLFCCF